MSIRIAIVLTLTIAAASRSAHAASHAYDDILNGPSTSEEVNEANCTRGGCGSEDCAALRDIARAFMTIERRDIGPGTDLPHTRQLPEQAASEKLRRDMMVHRARYADYCTILTKLAQHYSEYFIGHASIELSTRMDDADTGSPCTPSLLAAFPTTQDVRAMIASAREACQLNNRKVCKGVVPHQPATAR